MAGITSTAPSPSTSDQPKSRTYRFGLSAVVNEPSPYTARPTAKTRSRPQISPSFAPTSMNAAITSVYAVIAACTPVTVVSRSATICEIETFITLESSTITNCAAARMIRGSQRRIGRIYCAGIAEIGPTPKVPSAGVATDRPAHRYSPNLERRAEAGERWQRIGEPLDLGGSLERGLSEGVLHSHEGCPRREQSPLMGIDVRDYLSRRAAHKLRKQGRS